MSNPKTIFRRLSATASFLILILTFLVIVLWNNIVYTTPVGFAGVKWHRLHPFSDSASVGPLNEGLHVIFPWDKFYNYDLRLQSSDQVFKVVSEDGLHLEMTLTFRWRAVKKNVVELNETVGPNYPNTLLTPTVGSVAREVVARHKAELLYGKDRGLVQQEIYEGVVSPSYRNGITDRDDREGSQDLIMLVDVLIKKITLPEQVRDAIESKLRQAQRVGEYEFRVQTERLESLRKSIEAEGIRQFQQTVAPAITESYLRWRGIEATLQLAESENSKVVVIGNSATGLPLILDTASHAGLPDLTASLAASSATEQPDSNSTPNYTTGDIQSGAGAADDPSWTTGTVTDPAAMPSSGGATAPTPSDVITGDADSTLPPAPAAGQRP